MDALSSNKQAKTVNNAWIVKIEFESFTKPVLCVFRVLGNLGFVWGYGSNPGMLRNTMEGLVLIETCWKVEYENCNFVKNLWFLGLLQEARVSSLGLVNVLCIYNARDLIKKNEKRYALECKIFSLSNFFKSFQNLIFFSFLAWASTNLACLVGFLGPQAW